MLEPTREAVDQILRGVVLEFGASWGPHCQAIQSEVLSTPASHLNVQHIKVEDGKGNPLGRSFRVKLWPTLVFMRDGQVVSQLVRDNEPGGGKGNGEIGWCFGRLTQERVERLHDW